jgi:hypothetical protein
MLHFTVMILIILASFAIDTFCFIDEEIKSSNNRISKSSKDTLSYYMKNRSQICFHVLSETQKFKIYVNSLGNPKIKNELCTNIGIGYPSAGKNIQHQ